MVACVVKVEPRGLADELDVQVREGKEMDIILSF